MKRFLTACLLWISLACGVWRCAPPLPLLGKRQTATDSIAPPFAAATQSMLFKAHFQYGNKLKIGGLLLIKQTAPKVYRILLMAEMGATLFDFEFSDNTFKVHRSFEALNRPIFLKIIENDIKLLLLQRPFKRPIHTWRNGEQHTYRSYQQGSRYTYIKKGENWTLFQQNRGFRITFNSHNAAGLPDNITMQHFLFPLRLELVLIK